MRATVISSRAAPPELLSCRSSFSSGARLWDGEQRVWLKRSEFVDTVALAGRANQVRNATGDVVLATASESAIWMAGGAPALQPERAKPL